MTKPSAPSRAYRIGIDVGGTFTKAVLIDNASHEVVGRFSVLTTHSDPRGVAKGVVDVFRNVLEQSGVDPKEVIFLAHSTTQATNALLEGDVANVGVIGTGAALLAIILANNEIPIPYLYSIWLAPTVLQGSMDPTNSWTLWTIGHTKVSHGQFLRTALPFGCMMVAVNSLICYLMLGSLQ